MQVRDLVFGAFALLAFGCSQPPKAVFVDLDLIARRDLSPEIHLPDLPGDKSVQIPSQQASIPSSDGTIILDRASGKIEIARKLIEQDRENAIRILSRRLAAVRSEQIEVDKLRALEELSTQQAQYMRGIYDQIYAIFQEYAKERGPKFARAEYLQYRRPDLYISRSNPTNFAQKQREEMNALRKIITDLEADYQKRATQILDDAQIHLSGEVGAVQAKFETLKANAFEQALRDARRTIERATASSDLNLGQNRSVVISEVQGESIQVEGSSASPKPISSLQPVPVVSTAERKQSLEQQLEIWLKTRGRVRALTRTAGADVTEEFDAWRKSHKVGP